MKKSLFLFLFLLGSLRTLTAQTKATKTEKETAASSTSSNTSSSNNIPEKWKNESAVIIDQNITYAYYNFDRVLSSAEDNMVKETLSRRIKLQDKSAVSDFSEFYFYETAKQERDRERGKDKKEKEASLKISVVKPSGERVKVNISDAVEVKDDVPRFYRSYYVGSKKYKKIAIPNLNVGDVLEYQLSVDYEEITNSANAFHAFPAFNNTLSTKYPVIRQEYNLMLESGFSLNMNTYNGAPSYKVLNSGYDYKGKKTDKMRTFQIVDTDREKRPEEMMSIPLTQYPSFKFQVVARRNSIGSTEGSVFIGEKNEVKKVVEPEEVAIRFNSDFRQTYTAITDYEVTKFAKTRGFEKKNIEEKTKAIYGFVKYKYVKSLVGPNSFNYEQASTLMYKYERAPYSIKDFYFAAYMAKCFDEVDIDYEVIGVMSRNTGKIKDLLLGAEITWIVKVLNPSGKPIYLFPFNGYQTSDVNPDPYLYGGEGYSFVPSLKKSGSKNATATKVTVPVPDPSVSASKYKIVASFDESLEKLNVERISSQSGNSKTGVIPYAILGYSFLEDYYADYSEWYVEPTEKEKKKNEEKAAKRKKTKDDLKREEEEKEILAKRKEIMNSELKDDYDDIESYDSFRLVNPGILERDPTLVYNEKFKLKGLLIKAGRNYTLEIGKLLSKQPKLDENDLKPRQSDIQIYCPRIIEYDAELTLPAGYTIEDLKDLNFKIDNDMVSYAVSTTLSGEKLMLKTQKVYKKLNAPKTEWKKVTDVFNAAFDFSQKKVVLKKK